ncbi:RNA polymerase subunit sigma [Variovorax sp. WS11]|uniref:RNA polymerase sigma factor n=1 Tax=Variovorax sp. WS11 TaxID=1105204 RepID=UPI000D0DAF0D|nr:RNA polymerase sigma factor [Variovorax sp. WS11]NDZ16844.1 RNA polymerase sigma factor [Variovorax sp. WS11]PSL86319.1 RNA polymerase subunit sigma [Variovorax sp. WS11]
MHPLERIQDADGVAQPTDTELATRAAQGDALAFQLIMRRHNRLLFRTGRSILKDDDEAQDALQDAYLRAWRSLGDFRAEARLSTWLVRIVVNEALGRLRRRGSAQVIAFDTAVEAGSTSEDTWMQADPDEQPDRHAMRGETRKLIEAGIDALPEVFRTVLVLRAVEDMSIEEVAAALDIPEATVRTRFFRARGLLREALSREIDVAIGDAFSFAGTRCDQIVAHVMALIGRANAGPTG